MDYPDPDEEFELMHADELEMMNEFDDYDPPTTNVKPKSKRSLDFTDPCKVNSGPPKKTDAPGRLDRQEDSSGLKRPQTTGLAINGLYDSSEGCLPLVSVAKRTADRLFGDIEDIIQEERESKRAKVEDGRSKEDLQDLLIRSILKQRRQIQEEMKNSSMTTNVRVDKGQKGCMSRSVPDWPFLAVSGEGGYKIYLRLHSKEDYTAQIKDISSKSNNIGLLNLPYEDLYKEAMREVAVKSEKRATVSNIIAANSGPVKEERDLWVELYKPKNYLELLSNESTNRALLHWLKLWDKVVFNRELRHLKKADVTGKIEELDETGRPHQKVALLCGPPGLGKTTLGHMIAQQAGYNVVEMNASDDRSTQAFRTQLEAATQMKSVMGFDPRPNCLILDEIDGAPQASVDVLVKFVTDKGIRKTGKKKGGVMLKRPLVCICNDIYVAALRPLRQIAFTLHFPPTSTVRLGERLMEVCHKEKIASDLGTMMALAEKSHNDIRSCLSLLALLKAKGGRVSLGEIAKANLGTKDRQQGLFSVWQAVFHIPTKKSVGGENKDQGAAASLRQRFASVLRMVQSYGDYDRLAAGVFENYLSFKTHDSTLSPICNGLDWFCFYDLLSHTIQSTQIYSLYPYLPHAFITWHRLYAGIAWPKINYPTFAYEMAQKKQRLSQILDYAYSGMVPQVHVFQHRQTLLLDVVSFLLELISPNIRPVNIQLHTPAEKAEVSRVVSIMIEYNLTYTQERTPDGAYVFHLDPNMEELGNFGERDRSRKLGYPGRQMISKEVELEKIRILNKQTSRSHQKLESVQTCSEKENVAPVMKKNVTKTEETGALPNHLQKLNPKSRKLLDNQARDFFGRIVEKSLTKEQEKAKTDDIVKSDVWFHFKEGYNNAVRKNVYISDLQ